MITRDLSAFLRTAQQSQADFGPATARAPFQVSPYGFARADQSAMDSQYMAEAFWATALAGSLLGSDFTAGMTSQTMQ